MKRLVCALLGVALFGAALARDNSPNTVAAEQLPAEARQILKLIDAGGPFLYRRDGVVFKNLERRLPQQPRGYYREYTVPTPGSTDRGARRIVAGAQPPVVYYYTDNHYRSFRRIMRRDQNNERR